MRDISPSYALQKALAITRTSTILDSVVEVDIGKCKEILRDSRRIWGIPYLLSPAIFTIVRAIPAMRRLHTIHLARMILSRTELFTILSSPHLIHLILDNVQIPKISKLPPPKLRKLTLVAMCSVEALEFMITQLAASLEYLKLQWCRFRPLGQSQLPLFPCLRELHYHQRDDEYHFCHTFPDDSMLYTLFRLGPQLASLHLAASFHHDHVATFPKSLQHLSIEEGALTDRYFRINPLPQLMSLSLKHYHYQEWWDPILLPPFIRDHFPRITSLHLDIPWAFRDFALVMARSQYNLQSLELRIVTESGLDMEERERKLSHTVEIPADYLRTSTLPAALKTLKLEVVQDYSELGHSIAPCTRWIDYDVLPSVTGLGGPDLRSTEVWFVQPESKLARKRVLWRQWIKLPNGDWQMEGCFVIAGTVALFQM